MRRLLIVIAVLGLGLAVIGAGPVPGLARYWIAPPPWVFHPVPDQVLRLRMIDFAFRPSVVQATQTMPITLELVNDGATSHILVIPVLGVREPLEPGERRYVSLGRVEAGTYEFFCAIPEHRDAGMIGRLTVGPGIVAQSAAVPGIR